MNEDIIINDDGYSEMETQDIDFDVDPYDNDVDDSMDGDAESALASAGFGMDEDYCHDTPMGDVYGGE